MSWFMAGSAAVTTLSTGMAGSASAKQANKQSVRENQAIIKANVANTIRTGYRVGLANMQRGLQKKQAVQHGFDISKAGVEALGQVNANAAAAGSIGASVDAVANDVKMKVGEAQAEAQNQSEIDAENFKTQIAGIVTEGMDSLQGATKSNAQSASSIWGGALASGVSQFTSSYLTSKMNLGVGAKPATSAGPNTGVGSGFNSALWGMK